MSLGLLESIGPGLKGFVALGSVGMGHLAAVEVTENGGREINITI